MNGFIRSFQPLLKRLRKYILEIALLSLALIITIVALSLYLKNDNSTEEEVMLDSSAPRQNIFVDVSGAVKKPNLYQVSFGARIKEVIDKAGGLSDEADVIFFNRNFNLARIVTDQEKIYVPLISEINNGTFIQNHLTLDYTTPTTSTGIASNAPTDNNQLININSATIEELDQLPGVGQVTANKIIVNRPYSSIEELVVKKTVNKGVFEKIKSMITL
ncbi:Competence protein ComEA helix-hairpin-helix repeat protein [Candidatus Roizmanbacteria bacterium]|nr:Competence protein ComEA helix-hairpin-helix repeat protein [Candidatus Roizmanbacteria bacterium]